MYQKALVQQAWAKAGLNRTAHPDLAQFFDHFNQASVDCWAQLAQEVREKYPEYKERLTTPIWETRDPLIRLNLVRALDINVDDERAQLIKFIELSDPRHDAPALRAAAAATHPDLVEALARASAGLVRTE